MLVVVVLVVVVFVVVLVVVVFVVDSQAQILERLDCLVVASGRPPFTTTSYFPY